MIDDRDWAVAAVEPGEAIQVYLGYQEIGLAYMGYFNISDVSYLGKPRSIQLTGTSTPFQDLQKSPNIKEFVGKSVGEILSDIAGEDFHRRQAGDHVRRLRLCASGLDARRSGTEYCRPPNSTREGIRMNTVFGS